MANTRETIGDQATVDGLVANTLTEIEESEIVALGAYALSKRSALTRAAFPNVKTVGDNAFQACTGLTSIELPAATSLGSSAFSNCTGLTAVDLSGSAKPTISGYAFNGCSGLKHLVIRSSTMATLSATSALNGTPIMRGEGGIYVPSGLLATYKGGSNWSTFKDNIFPIDDYPRTTFDTITDTWAQIAAAEENGTYSTKYSVGDTKALTIGDDIYYAQIAAFDADPLASGSGNAKITWIVKALVGEAHKMNDTGTTTGGWASSGMRTYLRDTLYPTIQSDVKSMIKEVTKTYYDYASTSTLSCSDTVWSPSLREVNGVTTGNYHIEDSGPIYSGLYPTKSNNNQTARVKYNASGSTSMWWLRSAYTGANFVGVGDVGGVGSNIAYGLYGVALGFCT